MLLLKLLLCSPSGLRVLEPRRAPHTAYAFFRLSNQRFVRFVNCVNSTTAVIDCSAFRSFTSESPSAFTRLMLFAPVGILASVRNVAPVTHRLDYPTSLLLCSPSGLRVLEPRRASHTAYALNTPMRLNLLYLSSFSCWGVIFLYSSIALRISFFSSSPIAS